MARKKQQTEFVVFDIDSNEGAYLLVARGQGSTAECKRWVKERGNGDTSYRVAELKGPEIYVEVRETVTRKLVETEPASE